MTVTSLKKLVDVVTVDQGRTSEHLLTSTIVTVIEVRTDLFNCADEISKPLILCSLFGRRMFSDRSYVC